MLTIGSVLLLEPQYAMQIEKYKCRLVERKGDILYIDYPINTDTNRTAFLLDGTQLKATFVNGKSAFCFDTEVVGRLKQAIPMIKMIYPGDEYVMKIQRRQFVRIDTAVDIAIHSLNGDFHPFTAITQDLSAGGALVRANGRNNLKQDTEIKAVIVLPMQSGDYHYLHLTSHIIRIYEDIESGYMLYSIQFKDVTPIERQLLLRFSFERQLEMKKKGLEYLE